MEAKRVKYASFASGRKGYFQAASVAQWKKVEVSVEKASSNQLESTQYMVFAIVDKVLEGLRMGTPTVLPTV